DEQFTVVVPGRNVDPEGGVHVNGREPSTRSIALAEKVTVVPARLVACAIGAGSVSTGGVVSTTCITKAAFVGALPCASRAVHETVVLPSGNVDPDAGAHDTTSLPSTRSLAVGFVYVTVAPDGPVALAVTSTCDPIVGPVVSFTTTAN